MEAPWSLRLREWLSGTFVAAEDTPDERLALAALLVEMMRADFDDDEGERATVVGLLARLCGVDEDEAAELLDRGEQAANRSVSLYEHTRALDSALEEHEKFEVVAALWEVAFADGVLDGKEDYLAHRLADLLHVRHSDLMRIKNEVLERLQED